MLDSSLAMRFGRFPGLIVVVISLGSCSNSSAITPIAQHAVPSGRVTANSYSFQSINYKDADNEIRGINSEGVLIGNYSQYPSGGPWSSYIVQPPYQANNFQPVAFPHADTTFMYGIGNGSLPVEVGYVDNPRGETVNGDPDSIWGTVNNQGLWSLIRRHGHELDCKPSPVHELLGYDSSSMIAVGYYTTTDSGCVPHPWEVEPGDSTADLPMQAMWASAAATGIVTDGSGQDIVGYATFKSSSQAEAGWFRPSGGGYTTYRCCSASSTNPTIFNGIVKTTGSIPSVLIVGTYYASGKNYGFVFNETANHWTTGIEAFGSSFTVVTGVNSSGTICGWYLQSGNHYGFIAKPVAQARPRHNHLMNRYGD